MKITTSEPPFIFKNKVKNKAYLTLQKFREFFGYWEIRSYHLSYYNESIQDVVNSLNHECRYMCSPYDTACRELNGLAVHKLLLSGIDECEKIGIYFAKKLMNIYYRNHFSHDKLTFKFLEDMSYVADTLEKYKNKIDPEIVINNKL